MSYAEKNLAPGETIVYRARYHWIYYRTTLALLLVAAVFGLWWWISGERLQAGPASSVFGVIALALLAAALVHFLLRRIRASADEFVVTTRRVIRKTGLVAREAEHAPIEKIQDITVDQGVLARLLGYGTATLETASESGRIVFPDIAEPERFRSAIWGQTAGAAPSAGAASSTSVPAGALPGTFAGSVQIAAAARLAELEALHTRGLLTTEEYARKREEIIASL
ncbi:MAG TPA: PH domain-containing protein [Thermoanaerobaculia bacterium]|jgi:membrane protein YdbS with pleckstrin-like domain|nr:PH domain-containing protein [Thermoanaerobaculia bacterium]HEV8608805.1 PH domain-containing protein [Thermoanaerobaculia bacterium]